jgi:nucleotide-binding universal stress UspA family protein
MQEVTEMFEKILLPMDGSVLAEQAIPYVRDLASQLNAEIHLVHVCPVVHQNLTHMHKIYLDQIETNLRKSMKEVWGLKSEPAIKSEILNGEPAPAIIEYIKQNSINLVAVTTCGASGLRVWAMGSVADKVVRDAGIPTLLIRVKDSPPSGKGFIKRILLPVDSSDASKIAVPYGAELAKKLGASLTVFSMAQTVYAQNLDGMGVGVGVNWDAVDAATKKYVDEYLQVIEADLKTKGLTVDHITVLGIDASTEILELEKKIPADIVVMATRGRSGISRWAFGSTAERVLRDGELPLLLIRETSGK